MPQTFSVILSGDELLYVLVLYGIEDEEKFEDYDLNIEDTSQTRLAEGRKSLAKRNLVKGDGPIPQLDDNLAALVGTTVIGKKKDLEYIDEGTGLHVRFVKEEGVYLFRGSLE